MLNHKQIEPNELVHAMQSCDQMFEQLSESYNNLEESFHTLSKSLSHSPSGAIFQPDLYQADRLSAILHALPSGVVILDGRGQIVQCNPAAEDMLGIPLLGLRWTKIIERAFSPKADDGHDISLKDGRIVNISTTPLGTHPGQVILLHDVTKTRELQRSQQHNKRLVSLGEMAAGLAHQIRTPLSSMMLNASHLNNPQLDPQRRNRVTDRIISQVKHLETLVNDMLMFAKGGIVADEAFSLEELVDDIEKSATESIAEQEVSLQVEHPGGDEWLVGNRKVLQSAVQNLIDNAVQAMEGVGRLTIEVQSAAAGSVDIILTDTGPGISKALQERIFEPFYTSRASGTGLGLAVVKLVAKAHHGDVWLESEEGHGCRFGIRLPVTGKELAQNSQLAMQVMKETQ